MKRRKEKEKKVSYLRKEKTGILKEREKRKGKIKNRRM